MAKTESIAIQMERILDRYSQEVQTATNEAIDETAKESAQKLRNTSPERTGEYAKSWGVKKEGGKNGIRTAIVRNKDHYRLTHLLENGHVVRNGKGTYGRAPAIKHIAPVEEWAQGELPERIERKL